jgi:hypothetical protein
MFIVECAVANKIRRRSPISFIHVSLWCLYGVCSLILTKPHIKSNLGVWLRKVTKWHLHTIERGELTTKYGWIGWVWEIIGWSLKLQEDYRSFQRNIYLKWMKQNQKMSTCNWLYLESLGSWWTMPKNFLGTIAYLTWTQIPSTVLLARWVGHMAQLSCHAVVCSYWGGRAAWQAAVQKN